MQIQNIRDYVSSHKNDILKTFDFLHSIPEPAFKEKKTSEYLYKELKDAGYEVKTGFAHTAVIGVADTQNDGPHIGLRADMDALRYEKDGKEFFVHSCGHDANCTSVLWAAKTIKDLKLLRKGKLSILFQPAEETLEGAKAIIKSGVVDDLDYLIAGHLRPIEELEMGKVTPVVMHGASGHMKVKVFGQDAHGARPQQGVNAIYIASEIINAVGITSFDPTVPHSVKPTKIVGGGNSINVIPDYAEIIFDLRAQNNRLMAEEKSKLERTAVYTAIALGGKAEIEWLGGVPAAVKSEALVSVVSEVIRDILGESALADELYTSGGEDFHNYPLANKKLDSTVIGIGAGLEPGLHKVDMHFNHDAILNSTMVLSGIVNQLNEK